MLGSIEIGDRKKEGHWGMASFVRWAILRGPKDGKREAGPIFEYTHGICTGRQLGFAGPSHSSGFE